MANIIGFVKLFSHYARYKSYNQDAYQTNAFLFKQAQGILSGSLRLLRTNTRANKRPSPVKAPALSQTEQEFKDEQNWTWAAPTRVKPVSAPLIPIIQGKSLTKDEVLAGLSEVGGLQLDCVDMKASNMADFLIVATGKSPLHLRKMADMLVQTVKKRKLRSAPAYTGAEGYGVDDGWILVDTSNLIISLMDQETRDYYRIEDHWRAQTRLAEKPLLCNSSVQSFKTQSVAESSQD